MEEVYSIYVIIALSLFLIWFFFGGSSKQPTQPNPKVPKPHRDGVYKESREDRVRRRLKARF